MKLPAVVRSTRTELPCSVILGSCSSDVADANGFAYCSQSRLYIILSDLSVAVLPPPPSWARSKFFGCMSERFCFASGQWWCTNALVLLCFVWRLCFSDLLKLLSMCDFCASMDCCGQCKAVPSLLPRRGWGCPGHGWCSHPSLPAEGVLLLGSANLLLAAPLSHFTFLQRMCQLFPLLCEPPNSCSLKRIIGKVQTLL